MRARCIARANWRVDTDEGRSMRRECVVALGPWAPDVLSRSASGCRWRSSAAITCISAPQGNAGLTRPVLDAEVGYVVAPMEQGMRLTTGAEFAARDAPPTPVQFDRLMPKARELFPLGEPVESEPWLGRRPCFPDSRR